jgi:hypothetical protein
VNGKGRTRPETAAEKVYTAQGKRRRKFHHQHPQGIKRIIVGHIAHQRFARNVFSNIQLSTLQLSKQRKRHQEAQSTQKMEEIECQIQEAKWQPGCLLITVVLSTNLLSLQL